MGRPRKKKGTAAATATLEHFFAPATAEQLQQEQKQEKQQAQKKQERETPREPPAKKARKQAQAARTGKGYVKLCDRVSEDGLPMLRKSAKSVIIYTLIKKARETAAQRAHDADAACVCAQWAHPAALPPSLPPTAATAHLPDTWHTPAPARPTVVFAGATPPVTATLGVPSAVGTCTAPGDSNSSSSESAGAIATVDGRAVCAWDCGGAVRALDWASVRAGDRAALLGAHREVLAVSAELHAGTLRESGRTYRGPGAIQLWSLPCDSGTVLDTPRLEMCIAHEGSVAHRLAWCPLSSVAPDAATGTAGRLGLLAACLRSGDVCVYAVPALPRLQQQHQDQDPEKEGDETPAPVVALTPVFCARAETRNVFATCVAWCRVAGARDRLACGFSDGTLRVWALDSTRTRSGAAAPPEPLLVARCSSTAVFGVQWSPCERDVLAVAVVRSCAEIHVWDVRRPLAPRFTQSCLIGMTLPRVLRWLETNSMVIGSEDGTYASTTLFSSQAHMFRCAARPVEAVSESVRNAQVACVAADGTLRLCDLCGNHRIRPAPRTIPVFSVRPAGATVVLHCHPGTPDAPAASVDETEEDEHTESEAVPLPALTTLAYCPEPDNAQLIAFGGTGSPVVFVGAIGYQLPYVI